MQVVIFSSPQRTDMLNSLLNELKAYDVKVIDEPETFGKENFWKRWEQARLFCLQSNHDNYLILPDDVTNLDLKRIKQIHEDNEGKLFTCNVSNDGRNQCWGGAYFDCGGLTNRETLSKVKVREMPKRWFDKPNKSSGVGYQLTIQLRRLGAELITPNDSLCFHGTHDSVMHYEERKKNPLIATKKMKTVVGIATFKGRENVLKRTIKSLMGQVDEIRIYNNEKREIDLTDNGKFYFLQEYTEPIYYFSCDDDIVYPKTYIKDMIRSIEKHKTIVTHHGRKLKGKGVGYYRGHLAFRCTGKVESDKVIDVAGTGVTGFRTDYFNPVDIYKSEYKCMSDLVFSLQARKEGKVITVLQHKAGYLIAQELPLNKTIFGNNVNNDSVQSSLADEIQSLFALMPNSEQI